MYQMFYPFSYLVYKNKKGYCKNKYEQMFYKGLV